MSNLRLSKKHGINPALQQCFVCGRNTDAIILFGKLKNDAKAPHRICLDQEPCDDCKEHMKRGVVLISVDPKKTTDPQNPWRTGGWVVVTEDFIRRMSNSDELVEQILKKRMAFMPDEIWDQIGLPRGPIDA